MVTRIVLLRHGATALSAQDRFSGSSDPPLSDEGRALAEAAARRLAGEPIVAAYSSPMRRAAETAAIVARGPGVGVVADAALREIDHGRWEGLRQEEVKERFGAEHAAWSADPFTFAPEGGET